MIILNSAVQDAKAMQNFDSESLLMGAEYSQKVKATLIGSYYGSKDCVDLASSTTEFRIIRPKLNRALFHIIDFFRNSIWLIKLPFLASLLSNFSTICLLILSKFANKSAQKSSIFSIKASFERSLIFSLFLLFSLSAFSEARLVSLPPYAELKGLEKDFQEVFSENLDFDSLSAKAYLEPNERGVTKAKPYLMLEKPSLLVSVGSERSLFNLILCAQSSGDNCLGLVVRDIHPKIKTYIDYLVLLLRISKDCDEFQKLASLPIKKDQKGYQQLRVSRIQAMRNRIRRSDLNSTLKDYYLKNLDAFFTIYHEESKRFWLLPCSEELISYHKDKESFSILQKYARGGNIIASQGDINDLKFLSERKIGVIDISNIPSIAMVDFRSHEQNFEPRVIWTSFNSSNSKGDRTNYHSCIYKMLSEEERIEVDDILQIVMESYSHPWKKFNYTMISSSVKKILQLESLEYFPSYSEQFLYVLRLYMERKINEEREE